MRREAASGRRSAWLAEVGVDGSWRLLLGVVLGIPTVVLMSWIAVSQPASLPLDVAFAANWALAVTVGQRASVSITDGGIKVRSGLILRTGWSVPLREIATAKVVTERLQLLRRDPRRCILGRGPALEVTTTAGSTYAVSLGHADEAVAVLATLRERRASTVLVDAINSGYK